MKHYAYILLVSLFLSACANHHPHTSQAFPVGIDGKACAGNVITPPEGLHEINNNDLLTTALGTTGKGMLCAGKAFHVDQPVVVYRVWDSSKTYTQVGRWWSFDVPKGPRDAYQKANDICPSWSALDRMSQCTIKVGTDIVVGPGQSADCSDGLYPASPVNQVYIPNDGQHNQLFVENCTSGVVWP